MLEGELVEEYMARKSEIFGLASTHSLTQIIKLSGSLNKKNLAQHIQFFRNRLHGLPPHLADIYSIYRHFAFEVIHCTRIVCCLKRWQSTQYYYLYVK
jgi:hypothetical protein